MLVVIPARGGSKGLPGKNIKLLGGKPLIQYTIEAARKVFTDDQIIVSTDSLDIKKTVENIGLKVPFVRPMELATDTSGTYEVILHALRWFEENDHSPQKVILLQPTSPFRNENHIKGALEIYNNSLDMVTSVKISKSNPYFAMREEDDLGFLKRIKEQKFRRRQDIPMVWELNGAIYVMNRNSLKETSPLNFKKVKKFVMDEVSSLDIDTQMDWELAKIFFNQMEKLKRIAQNEKKNL